MRTGYKACAHFHPSLRESLTQPCAAPKSDLKGVSIIHLRLHTHKHIPSRPSQSDLSTETHSLKRF